MRAALGIDSSWTEMRARRSKLGSTPPSRGRWLHSRSLWNPRGSAPLPQFAGCRRPSVHTRRPAASGNGTPVQISFSSRVELSSGALQVHGERLLRLHVANQLKIACLHPNCRPRQTDPKQVLSEPPSHPLPHGNPVLKRSAAGWSEGAKT